MELSEIVPWGRSFDEYTKMFSLSESDLKKTILGCGDGPACFNAELSKVGGTVVSVDPVYQFNADQIESRIGEVYPQVMEQMSKNEDDYAWTTIGSVAELGQVRMESMKRFLDDYEIGKKSGRYVHASLPELPFENSTFELALCSHFLFLYSEHVSQEDHILFMKELCRVADEVRVYPLLSLDGKKSRHLEPVRSALMDNDIQVSLQTVEYQFQKGATKMLVAKCL